MIIEAIKHKDVRGRELMYLKVSNQFGEVILNVGDKSYNAVKKLSDMENDLKNEQKKMDNNK